MAKYHIARKYSVTQLAVSEDGGFLKDYTCEESSGQRVLGSLPAMPQLLPQSALATQQQAQTSRRTSDTQGSMDMLNLISADGFEPQ